MNREKLMKIFQKLLIYFLIACSINQIKKNIFTILSIQKSYLCINHLNFLRVLPNIKFYNEQRKKIRYLYTTHFKNSFSQNNQHYTTIYSYTRKIIPRKKRKEEENEDSKTLTTTQGTMRERIHFHALIQLQVITSGAHAREGGRDFNA